jgi:hypothetical protein
MSYPFTPRLLRPAYKKSDDDGTPELVAERFPPISDLPRGGADGGARGRPPIVDLPRRRRLRGEPPFYPFKIDNALRLNAADSAFLNWTPGTTTDERTATLSCWIKVTDFGRQRPLIGNSFDSNNYVTVRLENGDELRLLATTGGSQEINLITSAKFRDPSSFLHIIAVIDTANSTSSDRAILYVNGVRLTDYETETYPSQNVTLNINNNSTKNRIGAILSDYFDGYASECIWLDGIAASPTDFGQFRNGVWVPKRYTGSFGTNGFHLDFADAANLGKDVSGNGNDFTTNNITSDDQVQDTPTNNYPIWQANEPDNHGSEEAGLKIVMSGGFLGFAPATFAVNQGKYYFEAEIRTSDYIAVGVSAEPDHSSGAPAPDDTVAYGPDGDSFVDQSRTAYGASFGVNDIISCAFDIDNGSVEFFKNGASQGSISYTFADRFYHPILWDVTSSNTAAILNFGQLGFQYTPPTGFKPLNAANLPKGAYITSGDYDGNGSSNGPFVWTGAAFSEVTIDGTTYQNDGSARGTVDFLANGFKLRSTTKNSNGTTYSWSGVVSQDFKYANAQVN